MSHAKDVDARFAAAEGLCRLQLRDLLAAFVRALQEIEGVDLHEAEVAGRTKALAFSDDAFRGCCASSNEVHAEPFACLAMGAG